MVSENTIQMLVFFFFFGGKRIECYCYICWQHCFHSYWDLPSIRGIDAVFPDVNLETFCGISFWVVASTHELKLDLQLELRIAIPWNCAWGFCKQVAWAYWIYINYGETAI